MRVFIYNVLCIILLNVKQTREFTAEESALINGDQVSNIDNILQKKYQIKGITKSNNVLILVFGDNAKTIAENIEKLLKTK